MTTSENPVSTATAEDIIQQEKKKAFDRAIDLKMRILELEDDAILDKAEVDVDRIEYLKEQLQKIITKDRFDKKQVDEEAFIAYKDELFNEAVELHADDLLKEWDDVDTKPNERVESIARFNKAIRRATHHGWLKEEITRDAMQIFKEKKDALRAAKISELVGIYRGIMAGYISTRAMNTIKKIRDDDSNPDDEFVIAENSLSYNRDFLQRYIDSPNWAVTIEELENL